MLRYEKDQFYRVHHDQNCMAHSLAGVRLFTFFIYLHSPEGGGETRFPKLNVTVQPRKGSAVLWPNVRDHDVTLSDERTSHEAMPPTGGLKFSANLWLHQYDFRTPNQEGCDVCKQRVQDRYLERTAGGHGDGSETLGDGEEDEEAKFEL